MLPNRATRPVDQNGLGGPDPGELDGSLPGSQPDQGQ